MTEESIRKWFCHKLECYGEFINKYTSSSRNEETYYINLFTTGNNYYCADINNNTIIGIEQRALNVKKRFSRYIFVARDSKDGNKLKKLIFKNNKN